MLCSDNLETTCGPFGFFVHLVAAADGISVYSAAPSVVAVFFVALVAIDPVTALLLVRLRPSGVALAVLITVFTVFVLVTALPLRRVLLQVAPVG